MAMFDYIAVLYNPHSTHDAERIATKFANEIANLNPCLMPTQHAGHALELAFRITTRHARPLIISVSGDGGYNEVINGVMRAKAHNRHRKPVVAVVPAGNANDHYHSVKSNVSLVELVEQAAVKPMDVLRLTWTIGNKTTSQYAHSYIGFGISAQAGSAVNAGNKGGAHDAANVADAVVNAEPVRLTRRRITRSYDSITFANVPRMAKVMSVGNNLRITDGKFEVLPVRHTSPFARIVSVLRAVLPLWQKVERHRQYSFILPQKTTVQYDGEVSTIPARAKVVVESLPRAIDSLYK